MSFLGRSVMSVLLFSVPAFAGSSVPGIHNFFQVDDHVYRGGQPSDEGLKYLAKIGVKTVLDLREDDSHASAEEQAVKALGMQFVNVPMTGLTPPTEAQIAKILEMLEDSSSGPVFVHCKRGADRTGAVIAAYRIDHDHWENSVALKEAMSHGMSFFQFPRQSYIRRFQPLSLEAKTTAKPAESKVANVSAPAMALPTAAAAQ